MYERDQGCEAPLNVNQSSLVQCDVYELRPFFSERGADPHQSSQDHLPFVPAGRFTVSKHSSFTVERPNKRLFEDFTRSISRTASIGPVNDDSPVIACERAFTVD